MPKAKRTFINRKKSPGPTITVISSAEEGCSSCEIAVKKFRHPGLMTDKLRPLLEHFSMKRRKGVSSDLQQVSSPYDFASLRRNDNLSIRSARNVLRSENFTI